MGLCFGVQMLRHLFGVPGDVCFSLFLSPVLIDNLRISNQNLYRNFQVIAAPAIEMPRLISALTVPHHIFCITTDGPFVSPRAMGTLRHRLAVMPMFSTGFTMEKLERCLEISLSLDYPRQGDAAMRMAEQLSSAEELVFEWPAFDAKARLVMCDTFRPIYLFLQAGPIGLGRQCVVPGGEVSMLTDSHGNYSPKSRFPLDGEIVFFGTPIVHRGMCPCGDEEGGSTPDPEEGRCSSAPGLVSDERLNEVFCDLSGLTKTAIKAFVSAGEITHLSSIDENSAAFIRLTSLIEKDERYRKIHEIGVGVNPASYSMPGSNFLPNEMELGVHFGLGLTPFTEFHIDLVSKGVRVNSMISEKPSELLNTA